MRRALAVSLLLAHGLAAACGVCVEDKVAATYDHATVLRAADRGKVVVFAEIVGHGDPTAAARRTRGVEAKSVRVSVQPAAVSFVLDPRLRPPADALGAIERASGLKLRLLRVMP